MAEPHAMTDAAACSTKFFLAHVESLREALSTMDVNEDEARVEVEIEASKVHWSELTSAYGTVGEVPAILASDPSSLESKRTSEVETMEEWNERVVEDNVEVFQSLQARCPGGFFVNDNDVGPDHVQKLPWWMFDEDGKIEPMEVKLSSEKPFAEGAQAQLFHTHWVFPYGDRRERLVLKVFKEGTSLRDLQRLLPPSMLNDKHTQKEGLIELHSCNTIMGARLLKTDGRFAFLMLRVWGDLQKLIDVRMLHNNNQVAPFPNDVVVWCMWSIAIGMASLHRKGIVHRDLKAANIGCDGNDRWFNLDPIHLNLGEFDDCFVADYECSVGVVGTRFWRAPEILLALKNQNVHENPKLFSKEVDVYSYGMTCYEILTGGIPLEELWGSDYDGVIGGARPILPKETPPWMSDMVKRCWHHDPSMRPMFNEIVSIFRENLEEFGQIRENKEIIH